MTTFSWHHFSRILFSTAFLVVFPGVLVQDVGAIRLVDSVLARDGRRSARTSLTNTSNTTNAMSAQGNVTNVPTLDEISATMDGLDGKIQKLTLQLDGIQQNITSLENVTATGLKDLGTIQQGLRDVLATSQNNSAAVAILSGNAATVAGMLKNNSAKLAQEEQYLTELSTSLNVLGSSGLDTAAKVEKLEAAVNETVPTGKLSQAMDVIEKRMDDFELALKNGVDAQIQGYLGAALDDMRSEIRQVGKKTGGVK
ncbi:unnamed protein product [Amoebophrya sp. A25]|nr:unnamed protein product [Amoebophrya sp. A25]|eukprot:GSA25T00017928001.1